jgi:DNA-binding protein HU-beta
VIKQDIVAAISQEAAISKVKAEEAVEAFLNALKTSLLESRRIELRGFGVFEVKARKRGIGRNPRTGQEIKIRPGWTIRFKPGRDLQPALLKKASGVPGDA